MGTGKTLFTDSRRATAIVTMEVGMENLKTDITYDLAVPLLCVCSNNCVFITEILSLPCLMMFYS